MILANPTIIELDMGKLEDLVSRVDTHELREEDYATLHSVIESYVGLFFAVGNKNTTVARLRKILFGAKTEKTAAVCKDHPPDSDSAAHPASDVPSPDAAAPGAALGEAAVIPASPAGKETLPESRTPERGGSTLPVEAETASGAAAQQDTPAVAVGDAPAKPSGHGRNGANAYTAAEKIEVPHPTLRPGDPCPTCETGTVYETNRPGVVVRLVGQAPVGATIYCLQKLRCNPCGAVFTAELPPGAGGAEA